MMALDLRPLTLAELLDRSFSIYKRHLWVFVGIMAGPALATTIYGVLMQVVNLRITPEVPPDQIFRHMLPIFVGALLFSGVYMVMYAFALGATTIAVAQLYKGLTPSVGAAYRDIRRHGWRLILLFIWGTLRVGGAWLGMVMLTAVIGTALGVRSPILSLFIFFAGLGVSMFLAAYLGVRYGVSVPAVVLENLSAGRGLARSVELTEDNRWRVFLLILCALFISYATTALLQGPFLVGALVAGPGTATAVAMTIAGAVLAGVGTMFSGPIMIIGLAMIYYDLRIRKEALDLQMMLDSLDTPPA
jgi:hypothetical protein